jgi:hypothetical protein
MRVEWGGVQDSSVNNILLQLPGSSDSQRSCKDGGAVVVEEDWRVGDFGISESQR